jgi:iron complex outermembrane receptor protein
MLTAPCRAASLRPVAKCCQIISNTMLLSLLAMPAAFAAEGLDRQVTVDIPAQRLDTALMQLATQADLQVMLAATSVSNLTTPGVKGTLPVRAALTTLLDDSGMSYTSSDGTVTVIRAAPEKRVGVADQHSFRVADAGQTKEGDASKREDPSAGEDTEGNKQNRKHKGAEDPSDALSEVVVTGTHIRNVTNSASPVQIYTRTEIDETGAGTIQEFLQKIPQNFTGGASEGTIQGLSGGGISVNTVGGNAPNLRGLGNDATLVLINGHRVAPGNSSGNFVDVSMIPLSAVERVEIVTDGSSAVYGADAVGGVINFVLRSKFEGSESRARYGTVDSGARHDIQIGQTEGLSWSGGSSVLSYQYWDQTPLSAASRSFTQTLPQPFDLTPEQVEHAVFANIDQEITPGLSMRGDATYSHRTTSQSYVFGINSEVTPAIIDAYSGTLGTRIDLPHQNQLAVSATYSQSDTRSQIFLTSSAIPLIADYKTKTDMISVDGNLDGVLAALPSGPVRYAVGAQYRHESYGRNNLVRSTDQFYPSRNVTGAYAELRIPLLGKGNDVRIDPILELTASGRTERYSDFGSTSNPQFGIVWIPSRGWKIRGTYGKSFIAPALFQLNPTPDSLLAIGVSDPTRGGTCATFPVPPTGTCTSILESSGGNPNLAPQKATTWTVGVDVRLEQVPAMSLNLTYYDIKLKDRIADPSNLIPDITAVLSQEAVLGPSIVRRNVPAAVVQQILASAPVANFLGDLSTISTIIDARYQNISNVKTRGLDFALGYKMSARGATIDTGLDGTYIFKFDNQVTNGSPIASILNTAYNPIDLRLRGRAVLTEGQLSAGVFVNYVSSYSYPITSPATPVASWTTADALLSYELDSSTPVLGRTTIGFNVTNLTGRDPPYLAGDPNHLHFDGANASVLGRQYSLRFEKRW